MTVPLSASSPRRIAASRFGAELRRAMKARQVGSKTLGPQAGCAPSAIAAWCAGNNLPRLDTAVRLSESLRWPRLIALARAGRVGICEQCRAEPVSPLPLALRPEKLGDEARKAEGVHGPTHRDAWLEATRAGSARRWSRPGEREGQSEKTRSWFAAMSPAERAAHGERVSIGRRRPRVPA